jgi:serine/threonine protein kinase
VREPVKFGDYYLFERVAVGGMAEVFKAVSYGVEGFERLFALKRVLPNISEDQEFIEMFIDEAKIAVQLNHANIGQIFELGNADRSYFIAMEFVQGKDLRALFDTARRRGILLDPAMCCHIVKEVCEALEYAHNKRNDRQQPLDLIHRDVSPQNILVSYDGEVKLIDFGIAKAAGKASKTQAGILKGKFGYMSPEQVRGRTIDRRSDLFSLAVVLYELLTLERCFQGESDFSTLEKVRNVDIRRPAEINRNIPPELEAILLKGLTRDPENRYQSAAELQDALQKFLYQSGSFYARKDLGAFMRATYGRELEAEQARMQVFREYARQHIPAARQAGPAEAEVEQSSEEPFAPSLPALSWEQDEVETSVWDRAPSALTAMPPDTGGFQASFQAPVGTADPPAFAAGGRGQVRATAIDDELAVVPAAAQAARARLAPLTEPAPELRLPVRDVAPPRGDNRRLWAFIIVTLLAVGGAAVAVWLLGRKDPPQVSALTIDSVPPRVRLTINGRALEGQDQLTPITVGDLPPGTHTLRAEAIGHQPLETTVKLPAGVTQRIEMRLQPEQGGTALEINTDPPGATVFIDGVEQRDRTPLRADQLSPGNRQLRLVKDGYLPWEGSVPAAAGTLRRVETIKLLPATVSVTFRPEPMSAAITVLLPDGQRTLLGEGVVVMEGLPNSGLAEVLAEAKGFEPLRRKLPLCPPGGPAACHYTERAVTEELVLVEKPTVRPPVGPVRPNRPVAPGTAAPASACEGEDCPGAGDTVVVAPPTDAPPVKPPPAAGTGRLKLLAVPPARAFIGGKDMGWTPLLGVELPVGNHDIELLREQEPGAYRKSITVYIEADKETFRRVGN